MFRILLLLAVSLASFQLAHADEIENRIANRRAADKAKSDADSAARLYQSNTKRLRVYQNFAAVHGGLADSGTCKVGVRTCETSRYYGESCNYWSMEQTSFTSFNPASDTVLNSCRLTLNDGLACEVDRNSKDNDFMEDKWFTANCYDRAGNYSQLSFGANGGKIAPKKYPPRIRVGKGKCSYECDGDDGKRYLYSTSYCPAWSFGEDLPNGVHLSCAG